MTVTVRPYQRRDNDWEVDIRVKLPDNRVLRQRRKAPPGLTRAAACAWGQAQEQALLARAAADVLHPPSTPSWRWKGSVNLSDGCEPTLEQFIPRYLAEYCEANRSRPSTIDAKLGLLRVHLLPALGTKRLDAIDHADIQRLKRSMQHLNPKTVNAALCVLNTVLSAAAEWGVIAQVPVRGRWLKLCPPTMDFLEPEAFDRLVKAARRLGPRPHLTVLLAGDAGLRRGELLALRWDDLDLVRGIVTVARSTWRGHTTPTKGGRVRRVPMTARLLAATRAHGRRASAPTVLHNESGGPAHAKLPSRWLAEAEALAGLDTRGGLHRLRHTFCSRLALQGAPARAIQELAGHRHIQTTERYMHLAPSALTQAIGLLDGAARTAGRTAGRTRHTAPRTSHGGVAPREVC